MEEFTSNLYKRTAIGAVAGAAREIMRDIKRYHTEN